MNIVSTFLCLNTTLKILERRGEGRVTSELNDIFLIINELDEKKSLHALPRFVSDSVRG